MNSKLSRPLRLMRMVGLAVFGLLLGLPDAEAAVNDWTNLGAPGFTASTQTVIVGANGNNFIWAAPAHGTIRNQFWRYNIGNNTWNQMADISTVTGRGAGMAWNGGNFIYLLAGNDQTGGTTRNLFLMYNIANNAWTNNANMTVAANRSGAIVWGNGDFIYAIPGNSATGNVLYNFNTGNNTWGNIGHLPGGGAGNWIEGPGLAFNGNWVFIKSGNNRNGLFAYNTGNAGFVANLASATVNAWGGSAVTWDGGNFIYAIMAGNGAGGPTQSPVNGFVRYNIANNVWTAPNDINNASSFLTAARNITNPGFVRQGSTMYYLFGDPTAPALWAYQWETGDINPPGGVSNLTALQTANEGEIRLDWTSPGDDGETGALPTGSEFRIRYTTTTMIKSADFDSPPSTMAVTSVNISTNTGAVQAQTTTFFNLTGTTTRYFAIKTADDSSNTSVWNSSADVAIVNISALIAPYQSLPGGVSNLTALSGSVEGEIVLTWKAPGDDGETGTLNTSTFSIKYSSINVITSANFDSPPVSLYVTTITISTTSIAAGINVSTTVSNLTVGTIYWFAIKTRDDLENWSVWTSSVDNTSFNTLASTVPGAVAPNLFLNDSDISHSNVTAEPGTAVDVTATIRNSGGTSGYSGPTYVTFFATNTSTNTNYFISQATLGVITPALSGSTQAFSGAWTIPVEGLYNYWVKIDSANEISESNENDNNASITAEHPPKPPAGISNLTALTGPIEGTVVLRWTAPGDDGTAGIVSGYALRIASAIINSADFNSSWVQVTTPSWASNPTGESATNVSGGTDVSVTLTGLLAGGVTFFALKGIDDINQYGVWNSSRDVVTVNLVVSTMVQVDVTAPSAITTLAATLYSPTGIVTLTWTAPSEDGTWGTSGATYYDIRYATFSFTDRTAAGVLVATYTAGTFTPGSNETFRIGPGYGGVISGLRSGQNYFFNIWSQDNRGNLSDVTSPEASTPVVHLVISEVRIGTALDADDEFVELFNPTTAAIDLSVMGITLHNKNSVGTDSNFPLTIRPGMESIPSNGFWLITDRVGYTLAVSSDADFATSNNLIADGGVYIATYTTPANTNVFIDLVGFGTNPHFETATTANPPLGGSREREASGGLDPTTSPGNTQGNGSDTNDNSADFVERSLILGSDPQNSLSAVEGDARIPGGISNLTALAQSNGDVILEWTSPGDDEQTNDLILGSQFRIKYSSVNVISSGNFDSPSSSLAVVTITISTAAVTGSAQRRIITGLSGGILYWFAIKTKDEVGNWSVWTSSADVLTVNSSATITVTTHLGASVALDSFDFGALQTGTTNVSTSSGSVTNTGNVTQRFLIRVSNSADFTLTTASPGLNEFRYSVVFSTATPTSSDFGTNDAATNTNQTPTASVLARDSDGESVKGFNVSPGQTRFLWMRFEAPTSVSVNPQQNIFVTVVAEQQP